MFCAAGPGRERGRSSPGPAPLPGQPEPGNARAAAPPRRSCPASPRSAGARAGKGWLCKLHCGALPRERSALMGHCAGPEPGMRWRLAKVSQEKPRSSRAASADLPRLP